MLRIAGKIQVIHFYASLDCRARHDASRLIDPLSKVRFESEYDRCHEIGGTATGESASLDLEELLATRLVLQGNSGSGKSHLLRRLLEQSVPWVLQSVEGDFATLAEQYGHVVIDAEEHTERGLQIAAERARVHRVSTILNLEGLDAENQMRRAAAFLGGLFDVARDHWYPMLVVVDELFAPVGGRRGLGRSAQVSLAAMTNLMCRGRKRGLAGLIAT